MCWSQWNFYEHNLRNIFSLLIMQIMIKKIKFYFPNRYKQLRMIFREDLALSFCNIDFIGI